MTTSTIRGCWPAAANKNAPATKAKATPTPKIAMTTPAKPKKVQASARPINLDSIFISQTPFAVVRAKVETYKYDHIFCLVERDGPGLGCNPEDVGRLSNGFKQYLKRVGKDGIVRATTRHPEDGKARIWWRSK